MDLPNMEEYFNSLYSTWSSNHYGEVLFKCPKCKDGMVCRDNTVILPSYPPKNLYKCLDCGAEFYR